MSVQFSSVTSYVVLYLLFIQPEFLGLVSAPRCDGRTESR